MPHHNHILTRSDMHGTVTQHRSDVLNDLTFKPISIKQPSIPPETNVVI